MLPVDTEACQLCAEDTYRAGDATPENNICKPVPAGEQEAVRRVVAGVGAGRPVGVGLVSGGHPCRGWLEGNPAVHMPHQLMCS